MTTISNATLQVPGADLYYEVRGTGPMLLISQSGEGDVRRSEALVQRLERDYTVVTYDRRGLSRSTIHDRTSQVSVATHADDVHRLLAELTDEPAHLLGCSMGAVIGLHLAVDHPEQLRTLIAHEPVAPWLLAATERAQHIRELADCQAIFAEKGWQAALAPMVKTLGIDPLNQDREAGVELAPIGPERAANFGFFIGQDFTAIRLDNLDVAELQRSEVRIIPAVGATTPQHVFDYKCALELAAMGEVRVAEFPGGHNGNLTHPMAYAARIRELLAD